LTRGVPWDEKNFPPKNGFPELLEFLNKNVPWPKIKEDIFGKVLPWLKEQGVERIGIIGFCWVSFPLHVLLYISSPSCSSYAFFF
jgi:hypothetical protein